MKKTSQTPASPLYLIAMLAFLLAIGLLGYLTLRHYEMSLGHSADNSICNVSSTFNCDAVAASQFSNLLGIPVALWGMLANLFALVFALIYRLTWQESEEHTGRMLFHWSSLMVLVCLIMGGIALTQMSVYCLFCILSYATALIAWLVLWKTVPTASPAKLIGDLIEVLKARRSYLFYFATIPAAAWLINGMLHQKYGVTTAQLDKMATLSLHEWKVANSHDFSAISGLEMGASKETARMTVVEFADFLCGHCRSAAPRLHSFVKSHPDVRLVFHVYPLDGACNPNFPSERSSGLSCRLAKAVFCAPKDKAWYIHEEAFNRQSELRSLEAIDKTLQELAASSGIDWQQWQSCMASEEIQNNIAQQANLAHTVKIQGTPTIFVNGKMLPGGQAPKVLETVYQDLAASQPK